MVAFGPMFIHSSVAFDLAKAATDTTGLVVIAFVGTESAPRLIRGELFRLIDVRMVQTETSFDKWTPLKISRDPKDPWRWFDGFRTAGPAPTLRGRQMANRPWRQQSRADGLQRRRHKRKKFLESIHG